MKVRFIASFVATLLISAPVGAQDDVSLDNYVEANLISIFTTNWVTP